MFVSIGISLHYLAGEDYSKESTMFDFSTNYINLDIRQAQALSVFAFGFGGHSLVRFDDTDVSHFQLPNIYAEMKDSSRSWWKPTTLAYNFVLLALYIPIGAVCYHVYGTALGKVGCSR